MPRITSLDRSTVTRFVAAEALPSGMGMSRASKVKKRKNGAGTVSRRSGPESLAGLEPVRAHRPLRG